MQRPITSRMHGALDYPVGIVLIAAPWIFGFSDVGGAAVAVPMILGALIIVQSLITDYELSIANIVPMPAHLTVDLVGGVVLALSPVVFGFTDEGVNAWLPHVAAGIALTLSALLTRPYRETVPVGGRHRTRPA